MTPSTNVAVGEIETAGDQPFLWEAAGLWLYGNLNLLRSDLAHVCDACGPGTHAPSDLRQIEKEAEEFVLSGKTLVCGIHNPAHRQAAVVPLRWGSSRIVVFSGGFFHHLGENLKEEPIAIAKLWRYQWDPLCDLAVSRNAPSKRQSYRAYNKSVDRVISRIACGHMPKLPELVSSNWR